MEFIMELFAELLFEGSKNKKIPKPLRFIFLSLIFLFFITVIGFIAYIGIKACYEQNISSGIILIVIALLLAVGSVLKLRKILIHNRKRL